MQGMNPFRFSSMRFSSIARKATNHDTCKTKMAAMATALLMQNDSNPGITCEICTN
jgi:hypothetical protein